MTFSILGLLVLFLVALACGYVAQRMFGLGSRGLLATTGFGLVGGLLGAFAAGAFGAPTLLRLDLGGVSFPLVWGLVGTLLVVGVVSAISHRGARV